MRAQLKPQASERKSSGKGDKGHLVTKGFHPMSEKAKRKNCSRYVIQVKLSKNLQSLCRNNMVFTVTD